LSHIDSSEKSQR